MLNGIIKTKRGTWAAVTLLAITAALACGAAGKGKDRRGPLEPTTYDPQVSLAPLVEKVSSAVVNIKTETVVRNADFMGPNGFFEFFFGGRGRPGPFNERGRERKTQAAGSGFVIDSSGLVVTNHHVVENVDEIEVQLADERTYEAEVVGSDERTDVALLRLKGAKNLSTVDFGDSDRLRVGDRVVAIGNPFGLDHTVTAGIVSAKERVIGAGPYDDFIQTDASINPGNSGGPLFDLSGRVVGINTAINRAAEGIGFAIPSNLASRMIDSIRTNGRVVRGWLGVAPQVLTPELAKAMKVDDADGALVANVEPGSPAEKGGLKAGDVIVKIDKKKLNGGRQIFAAVAALKPGQTVPFTVYRDGKKKVLNIVIGHQPGETIATSSPSPRADDNSESPKLGLTLKPLTDSIKNKLGAQSLDGGALVADVNNDSPLAGAVQGGDIIVEVNRERVKDNAHLASLAGVLHKGDDLLLLIFRRGAWIYQVVRL